MEGVEGKERSGNGWADNAGVGEKGSGKKQSICLFGLHHHLSFGERS
jgi:hypothetical protein